jgi:IS30 family transposase
MGRFTGPLKYDVIELMTKSYTHLPQEERYQIYAYKKAGFSKAAITEALSRHVSAIKRTLHRKKGKWLSATASSTVRATTPSDKAQVSSLSASP